MGHSSLRVRQSRGPVDHRSLGAGTEYLAVGLRAEEAVVGLMSLRRDCVALVLLVVMEHQDALVLEGGLEEEVGRHDGDDAQEVHDAIRDVVDPNPMDRQTLRLQRSLSPRERVG